MKKTFFYKLNRHDKKLFFLLAVFTFFTLLFNLTGNEVTPFFVWGMYSEKEKEVKFYEIYRIAINGDTPVDYSSGFTDNNRFFITSPLLFYQRMTQNDSIDPGLTFLRNKSGSFYNSIAPTALKVHNGKTQLLGFMNWYKNYLQQTTHEKINNVTIQVLKGHYSGGKKFTIDSGYQLAAWKNM